MQLNSHQLLSQFHNLLQTQLFPKIEMSTGALSKQAKLLCSVLAMAPLQPWVQRRRIHIGRRPHDRQRLATAFIAKAVYNLTTTRHLMERLHSDSQLRQLCGWECSDQIPAEATFSRSFSEFAKAGLPARIHEALVRNTQQGRVIEYIARDSTAIDAREHLPEDYQTEKARRTGRKKRGPGRPRKKKRCKSGQVSRLVRQQSMSLREMLADLPRECSLGVKTSSKGHQQYWRGFKLHWDVADGGRIPISCILTGARVHDSQVAIPLMTMSSQRVRWACDVMDSGYDADLIRIQSKRLGHEALIKPVKRQSKTEGIKELSEADKERFKKRTIVEQLNGRLKDEFGGRIIYFRGAEKVMAHLMFGVLALTVDQILRQIT